MNIPEPDDAVTDGEGETVSVDSLISAPEAPVDEPATADASGLVGIVEALVFASPDPITLKQLCKLLDTEPKEDVVAALAELARRYTHSGGLQFVEVAGGYQIVTRPELHEWVRRLFHERTSQKLSVQALETLAVIAYKQPITAMEVTEIRGVNTTGVVGTLLERGLVKIAGRKQVVGRPFLYATTREFLDRFGLKDLTDLPKIEDMADALGFEPPAGLAQQATLSEQGGLAGDSLDEPATEEDRAVITGEGPVDPLDDPADDRETRTLGADMERLQKVLSTAGVASRRMAEELIQQGRVSVNGTTVTTLGTKADPATDEIRVDGRRIKPVQTLRYLLVHKPRGYVTTRNDPQKRKTVMDLLGGVREYVYPVGRLDYDSEGLLLVTNDGDLAAALTHPSHEVEREYRALVTGVPDQRALDRLTRGVVLDGRRTSPAVVRLAPADRDVAAQSAVLLLTIREGRNRQVRRMCEAVGHPVQRLTRVRIGPLRDDRLRPGQVRDLTPAELQALKKAASAKPIARRR